MRAMFNRFYQEGNGMVGNMGQLRMETEHKSHLAAKRPRENKYLRKVRGTCAIVDVYDVLEAFEVKCPARQHAIKKLLCSGIRGKGDTMQDLQESLQAVQRAIQMEKNRQGDADCEDEDDVVIPF